MTRYFKKDNRACQQGFAMVAALGFLPILILAFSSIFLLKALINPDLKTLQVCRTGLLKAQTEAGLSIEQLLLLNKEVLLLRRARDQAEQELEEASASEFAPAAAAALAHLEIIIAKQTALQQLQISILRTGTENLRVNIAITKANLQETLGHFRSSYQFWFSLDSQLENTTSPALAVRAVRTSEAGPPEYELPEQFTAKQAVHVSWKYDLQKQDSKGASLWKKTSYTKHNACAASLSDEGAKPKPVLTLVRSY